jgi:tryptophan synthase alpha subunit
MNKTIKKFKAEDKEIPYILQIFEKEILNKYDENFFKKEKEKLFKIYNEETLIPSVFNRIEL